MPGVFRWKGALISTMSFRKQSPLEEISLAERILANSLRGDAISARVPRDTRKHSNVIAGYLAAYNGTLHAASRTQRTLRVNTTRVRAYLPTYATKLFYSS